MKNILKITGITAFAIVLALILLPFVFKDKIMEIAKREVNKTMNAKIDFKRLGLNFFKNFPNASVSLDSFYIAGIEEFEQDTLVFAEKIIITVNLKSLFSNSGYEVTKVWIDNARLYATTHENGNSNWDIAPKTNAPNQEQETDNYEFKLLLKKVVINNANINYEDIKENIKIALKGLNLTLSGDMTMEETVISTQFTIAALDLVMDKISFFSGAKVHSEINLNADLKNKKFTLANNYIQINEIKVNVDGWLAMLNNDDIDMDISLNAPATQFKDILSLIPAIYARNFQQIQTLGEVSLEAFAKGIMKDGNLPSFDAKLDIANAMFRYPDMPGSVTNINAGIHIFNTGGSADNTIIDISKFHFEIGNNPFDLKLKISTPISDTNIDMTAVGKLNLNMLQEIYPLENMQLSGYLNINIQLATCLSYVQKEKYEQVNASGTVLVENMLMKSNGTSDIHLKNAVLAFSPRYAELSSFAVQIGKNDIAGSGKLENYIPYLIKNETIKGNLIISSNYFNFNDLMSGETKEYSTEETATVDIVKVPKNIDFNLTSNFKQVIFDNMDMNNVAGQLSVKDGKVDMKNISMNILGGKLKVNGYYDTRDEAKQPEISLLLDIQDVSFSKTFSTFVTIQKLAPIFENLAGNYSTSLQMNAPLSNGFTPVLSSLKANGLLQSSSVEVSNVGVLNGLSAILKNESLKELKIQDLKLPFAINDGRVSTKPFAVNFVGGAINLEGSTGLDQSIDYTAKVNLAGKLNNNYINNVSVKISGSFTSPKFTIDTKDIASQALASIASSVLGAGETALLTNQVKEQAEVQIENIRNQAKEAGKKLVEEAGLQGQKLIDEANKTSNPLAKMAAVKAAEIAAKKLKDEAQSKADQLNAEAEKRIDTLLHNP